MKKGNISIFVPHLGCPNQCSFCNQKTITGKEKQPTTQDVIDATETALKYSGYEYEIAFFGGSFTAIDREYMVSLLSAAYEYVKSGKVSGIRISTRPDCIDEEILDVLKSFGVTSIELGAQSMDDEVLTLNNRGHLSKDVENASKLIKEYDFSLGLQMMTGLYGDTDEKAVDTAKKLIALSPDTIRIYPTVVLKDTYLAELAESGIFKMQTLDEAVSLCAKLIPMFEEKGIKVIRVGLHSSENVKKNRIGGAYHEAFRELVESKILFDKIEKNQKGEYTVFANSKTVPKITGQKRANILALEKDGYILHIVKDNLLKDNELRLENGFKKS